jgi:hypothetical protein
LGQDETHRLARVVLHLSSTPSPVKMMPSKRPSCSSGDWKLTTPVAWPRVPSASPPKTGPVSPRFASPRLWPRDTCGLLQRCNPRNDSAGLLEISLREPWRPSTSDTTNPVYTAPERKSHMVRMTSAACLLALLNSTPARAEQADVIFTGGKVVTSDPSRPTAEAVAVAGERI